MAYLGHAIKGVYRDVLHDAEHHISHDSGWRANTFVNQGRVLLAGFMKSASASGIQSMAVGAGTAEWDATEPPAPPANATALVTPYSQPIRLAQLDVAYLDDDDKVSKDPTSRLQITARLMPGYPVPIAPLTTYPLREFGLFGSLDNTLFMINYIRHPVIHKAEKATLIRVVRLYF